MTVLGIDYGRVRIGLALADGPLAEPLITLSAENRQKLIEKIATIVTENKVEKIIIGLSEGKMAQETLQFASSLEQSLGIKVISVDETLTTHEAQEKLTEAHRKSKQKRKLIDTASAAIILQSWLDHFPVAV